MEYGTLIWPKVDTSIGISHMASKTHRLRECHSSTKKSQNSNTSNNLNTFFFNYTFE